MLIGAFLYPTGYHVAAWRHPSAQADAGVNFAHYAGLARKAEDAGFDFLFLPDSSSAKGKNLDALSRTAVRYVAQFEPTTLLAALAAVTTKIGLIATVSTSFNEPYNVARAFASLDHISGGRMAWNLVTSQNPEEAANFSLERHPAHADRYRRAREFALVVRGLWDSWDDDAFPRDKITGLFFDPEKRHVLHHRGEYFSVQGPLNLPRTPQGRPLIVQAGASASGRDLAAETADLVFTAQNALDEAVAFRNDIRARAAGYGRRFEDLKVIVGVQTHLGLTSAEAEAKRGELTNLIHPAMALSLLEAELGGFDLSAHQLDGPVPELPPSNSGQSRQTLLLKLARRENYTLRQLADHVAGARGHLEIAGTPSSVADTLQAWLDAGAADGFMFMPALLPAGLEDVGALLLPELRRRGLLADRRESATFRERVGLPKLQAAAASPSRTASKETGDCDLPAR
jgi:FMN-dependent oxidoreductase (nitrilotriacetate monooxygenase family)